MSRFTSAVSDDEQEERRANATPTNTQDVTLWGIRTWEEWTADHVPAVVEGKCPVMTPLLSMPVPDFAYWLGKFVLEVRKKKDASECSILSENLVRNGMLLGNFARSVYAFLYPAKF